MVPQFPGYERASTFQAADTPLLVVDTDLVVRDINPACLDATQRRRNEVLGIPLAEAFPDNPDDEDSTRIRELGDAFETVFRTAARHHLPIHRHDVPSRDDPTRFVRKDWISVTTRLLDDRGRVVGALHHAEDVTAVAAQLPAVPPEGVHLDLGTWSALLVTLANETRGHERALRTARELQRALDSRVVIEQAKGLIAGRTGVGVDEAFTRLRQHARRNNTGIHEIAHAVVDLGLAV